MKILRTIILFSLAVLLAVQVPFVYRRYKIGQLANRISELQKAAADDPRHQKPGFSEYKGVMHVHTFLGGHSTGTFDELIKAANSNGLDFVVMTEHYENAYDTSALTLKGRFGKTLFVNGQEVDTNDGGRFLLLPGSPDSPAFAGVDSTSFLEQIHSEGRIAINNYPERNRSDVIDFDGMEAYSLHINAKASNPFTAIFDVLWSFSAYPEATYATYFRRNDDYLRRYDAISAKKRLLLTAGADAHSNKGYYLLADDEGNKHFGIKIDPYETVFRLVRMHVLLESGTALTGESLIDALKKGHAYVGFDVLSDASGFSFTADSGSERRIMGDEIEVGSGVKLTASAPVPARFVLFKDGERIEEAADVSEFSVNVINVGVYRVEVYLDRLGEPFDRAPWIMSNPIYVR
ncbi:MAG: hypothetical protein AB7V18_09590 [Pyrinomonadaceae bacterium]